MKKLSVCMIVKDEEDILEKGVRSIEGLYDELIILDTGSIDHSKLIAQSLGAKIYDYTWVDDFSHARRTVQSYAQNDYILIWDADWVLSKSSKEAFLTLKNQDFQDADHICFNWINEFNYETLEQYRLELRSFIYNKTISVWKHRIHEDLVPINPKHDIITFVEKGVDVYHYKDKTRRKRYDQNITLIKKTLQSDELPTSDQARQHTLLGQAYFYDKNYYLALEAYLESLKLTTITPKTKELAIYAIEKAVLSALGMGDSSQAKHIISDYKETISSSPKYTLLMADIAAVENRVAEALVLYKTFQSLPNISDLISVDSKRYLLHPADMINSLSIS